MAETRHDALWRRVEAHLDARTDPFQDAALARELRAVPEAERATQRVLARLGVLRGVAHPVVHGNERAVGAHPPLSPLSTLPRQRRLRSRLALRVAGIAACAAAAAAAAFVALVRDTDAPQSEPGPALAALDARPELGVIYSAQVELEHSIPPPPRAALVVHEPRHVFGWSLAGNPR
jgi:hypothetical protein